MFSILFMYALQQTVELFYELISANINKGITSINHSKIACKINQNFIALKLSKTVFHR